jgi:hypothetical protein
LKSTVFVNPTKLKMQNWNSGLLADITKRKRLFFSDDGKKMTIFC